MSAWGATATLTHDAPWRLTELGAIVGIEYDIWDRIATVQLPHGSRVAFSYNESGQLVCQTDTQPDGTTAQTRSIERLY